MDHFTYGGVCSADYGAVLTDVQARPTPQREVSFSVVPRRHGETLTDGGRYSCVEAVYRLFFRSMDNFDRYRNALLSLSGWQRLEDSFDPGYYRTASAVNVATLRVLPRNQGAEIEIRLRCQPQRWFISGEEEFETADTLAFVPPFEIMPSQPLITVYGSGESTLTVGDTTVQILQLEDHLILDCAALDAYKVVDGVSVNCNSHIYAPEFPILRPGSNLVAWTGGITRVKIVPRWWKL